MALAALMVLSVVAMSAAFAGAAAADSDADKTLDADSLSGDDVWIGQTVKFTNLEDPSDLMQGGDTVDNLRVDDSGNATVDTSELDDGRYYIDNNGTDTGSFWVNEHEVETEFDSSVASQDAPATISYEDVSDIPRDDAEDYADVLVTGELEGDSLSDSDLDQIFSDSVDHDDDDAVLIEGLNDSDQIEADFAESDVGDYEFTFDVTDTTASDNASVTVTDDDADYEFVNVEDVDQGDFAEITIGVDQVDSAAVVIHEESLDFASAVQVSDIEDDEVVLLYNTHAPSDAEAWSVHDDYDAEVTDAFSADEDIDQPLPNHNWDLNIGPSDNAGLDTTDNSVNVTDFNDFDRDRLVVDAHDGFGDTVSSVAPADEDVDDLEDFDEYATEADTIAQGDKLLMTLEDFGADGAIDHLDEDDFVVEITQEKAGLIDDDVVTYNSTDEGGDYNLTVDLVSDDVDEYDGDLVFAVSIDEGADEFNYDDATHAVTFTVTDENDYVAEDEEYEAELDLEFEERNIDWDAIDSLPADSDATATGTTNVAPGTELEANADSPSSEGGFVDYTDTVVADDYTFAAEFDLEGEQVGSLFDITAEETYSGDGAADDAVLTDVTLDEAGEDVGEKDLDVSVDYPSQIDVGADADFDVTVTNNKDSSITADLTLELDGEEWTEELEIDGDSAGEHTFTTGADLAEGDDYDFSVTAESDDAEDTYEGTLTVGEKTDDSDDHDDSDDSDDADDSDDSDDDSDDDGTPGFGVAVAVVALLAAAMLALRRQN
ncbi:PGF-CTERM sorting domain-containing protein [Natronorubrum sp. JWXQ-INN-674]|uniref:PGF-CTERM sorting domain-containing protein n=2 Tax=Natronorubrum halalkaliphilum TaxID=2691917 RepID=A0A6B0VGH5_9EURY|nr:PGF-CTERM sorting domain-containing protein [Natronorubrum halalkaliphilum]